MARKDTVSDRIQQIVERQDIRFLLHFTQLQNLPNIIQHGILPRELLDKADFDAYAGAKNRLDGDDQSVSLSISAVSQKIFAAKTKGTSETDWVILFLDPSILWTSKCRFNFCNAATREMRYYRKNIYIGGPWALNRMFSDEMAPPSYKGTSYREETETPSFLTTDPDAEVQVLEPEGVAPEEIIGAWACRRDLAEAVQSELNLLPGVERDVLAAEFTTISNSYSKWILPKSML